MRPWVLAALLCHLLARSATADNHRVVETASDFASAIADSKVELVELRAHLSLVKPLEITSRKAVVGTCPKGADVPHEVSLPEATNDGHVCIMDFASVSRGFIVKGPDAALMLLDVMILNATFPNSTDPPPSPNRKLLWHPSRSLHQAVTDGNSTVAPIPDQQSGAAVQVTGGARLYMRSTYIIGSSASYGAAVAVFASYADAVLSEFIDNEARRDGGAFALESDSVVKLSRVKFCGNRAGNGSTAFVGARSELIADLSCCKEEGKSCLDPGSGIVIKPAKSGKVYIRDGQDPFDRLEEQPDQAWTGTNDTEFLDRVVNLYRNTRDIGDDSPGGPRSAWTQYRAIFIPLIVVGVLSILVLAYFVQKIRQLPEYEQFNHYVPPPSRMPPPPDADPQAALQEMALTNSASEGVDSSDVASTDSNGGIVVSPVDAEPPAAFRGKGKLPLSKQKTALGGLKAATAQKGTEVATEPPVKAVAQVPEPKIGSSPMEAPAADVRPTGDSQTLTGAGGDTDGAADAGKGRQSAADASAGSPAKSGADSTVPAAVAKKGLRVTSSSTAASAASPTAAVQSAGSSAEPLADVPSPSNSLIDSHSPDDPFAPSAAPDPSALYSAPAEPTGEPLGDDPEALRALHSVDSGMAQAQAGSPSYALPTSEGASLKVHEDLASSSSTQSPLGSGRAEADGAAPATDGRGLLDSGDSAGAARGMPAASEAAKAQLDSMLTDDGETKRSSRWTNRGIMNRAQPRSNAYKGEAGEGGGRNAQDGGSGGKPDDPSAPASGSMVDSLMGQEADDPLPAGNPFANRSAGGGGRGGLKPSAHTERLEAKQLKRARRTKQQGLNRGDVQSSGLFPIAETAEIRYTQCGLLYEVPAEESLLTPKGHNSGELTSAGPYPGGGRADGVPAGQSIEEEGDETDEGTDQDSDYVLMSHGANSDYGGEGNYGYDESIEPDAQ